MDSKTPFSTWVTKSVKFLKNKAKPPNGVVVSSKRFYFDGLMVVNSSAYCPSPNLMENSEDGGILAVEKISEKGEGKVGNFIITGLEEEEEGSGDSSLISGFLGSEANLNCENENGSFVDSPSSMEEIEKPRLILARQVSSLSVSEMMKERFAKLLLGEDMSGCGNGVCTALAISNAVTNLCATLFGQVWRLEPLHPEKKLMWQREMECLLCVSNHIVELIPSWQTFPDGSKLEVMTSRPRSDLYANLPALRKLDNMLLEILDSFKKTEFWYVDHGTCKKTSVQNLLPRQEDKWWLPIPQIPPGGLTETSRKMLQHRRDCTNQILKAAMTINSATLAEMDIPDSYLDSLPKNGKSSLGDLIHRFITSEKFSAEYLLDCLALSSEHHALEIANKVEAAIYVWRRTMNTKPLLRSNSRSSWEMVKDLVSDADKRELLAGRAETLLVCLKQRFPGLPQTTLDTTKIQSNKDVGKSLLESYSRVLESLSFNIVARIDDLLYVDNLSKQTALPLISPAKGCNKSPFFGRKKQSILIEKRLSVEELMSFVEDE